MFPCHCPDRIRHPICFARTQSWSRAPDCSGYRDWIINKHFRNSEQHVLSSMSSGEHPLRAGIHDITTHNIYITRNIPRELHLSQEYIYLFIHSHGPPRYIARPGKAPTTALLYLTSNRRPINHRHANRRKSPTPDYPKPDYHPPTQRFSATSPRTSLALGKLPTRRRSLSSVSAGVFLLLPA